MSLLLGTHASAAGGVDKTLQRAVDVGAESCQFFSKSERRWSSPPVDLGVLQNFHDEYARVGPMPLVIHDSYLINLASPKDDLHTKSISAFADELERADQLNVPFLVTHPGAHTGSGVEEGIARFADSLNRIFDTLPNNTVITCLETTAGQGTALGRTFEELAAIIDRVEDKARVGVCFDTCHAFAAGYDLRTEDSTTAVIDELDRVLGLDRLKVVHVNDSKMPFASHRDRHEHIGDGEIGLPAFRALVNDPRLDGIPAILETEKDPAGEYDRRNLATLRGLIAIEP